MSGYTYPVLQEPQLKIYRRLTCSEELTPSRGRQLNDCHWQNPMDVELAK